jgi:hypothetical protein
MMPNRLPRWLRQIFNPSRQERRQEQRCFRPCIEALEDRQLLAVFLVTSNLNGSVGGVLETGPTGAFGGGGIGTGFPSGVAGDGTLRAAILAANATPGPNTIEFDLEPGGPATIALTSPLPTLTNAVTIDGTSQPGWISSPLITVDGSGITFANNGLTTTADGCKIEGLVLQDFLNDGIGLYSNNNVVTGNYLENNGQNGVEIANAVTGNTIGGTTVRGRNVISGNVINGVLITEDSTNNVVQGNYIGIGPSGASFDPAQSDGVDISGGASNNTVGGTAVGAGNVISFNTGSGVRIDSTDNLIQGNKIGTDPTGTVAMDNGDGVDIYGSDNTVGGTTADAGNLISGNSVIGILIKGNGNLVQGNKIGTDVTGAYAVPNAALVPDDAGVYIYSASNNTVGGTTAGAGNLISGNDGDGILIYGSFLGDLVQGNKIGTDVTGTVALANKTNGVEINDSNNTLIGTVGAGNVIAFNQNDGVLVDGGADGNWIRQNSIFANAHLGIELGSVATETSLIFGNNDQLPPILGSATFNATTKKLTIVGTMPDKSGTGIFNLDFFANTLPVSGLVAQGAVYLGSLEVTTKAATLGPGGRIPFTATLTITATAFSSTTTPLITATATDSFGNTSQFSNAVHDPVLAAPAFTSPKTAAFTVTTPGSFSVTTSGFPTPTLTAAGTLPRGLTFNHTTGVLSGTPAAGTSGTYVLHLAAKNGIGAAAAQILIITVNKLITQVAIPDQVNVTAPTKVTALGHHRFEAVFTLTESAVSSLAGRLVFAGFTELPSGVTFDVSSAAAFPKNKKLTLHVVFTNTTTTPLATLLAGFTPIVDDVLA